MKWMTIVNPMTFEPIVALQGTGIELSIEFLKDKRINENELMFKLLESTRITSEEAVDAYVALRQYLLSIS